MQEKKKINIGLDIGIASVGWAIISTDYLGDELSNIEIIDHGVRLFPTVDSPKDGKLTNVKRREKRSARRQVKRRKTLKRDFIKYLIDNKVIKDIEFDKESKFVTTFLEKYITNKSKCPYDLRKKGLTQELTFEENIFLMYWYLSHRGFKYDVVGSDETKARKDELEKIKKEGLFKQDDFPINNQIRFYEKYGHYKGALNRQFHNDYYIKEIEEIFKNQKNITPELKNTFLDKEKGFFRRQRSFEIGPGGKKSPSKYGLYAVENGQIVKKYENIWAKTIGKCSIYQNEYRAPKKSLSAELFNLLNDLNNLSWGNKQKLTKEDKIEIIKIGFEKNITVNRVKEAISKKYDIGKDQIKGFRIETTKKKKAEIITKLSSLFEFNFNASKTTGQVISKPFKWEDFYNNGKWNLSLDSQNLNLIDKYVYQTSLSSVKDKRLVNLGFLKDEEYGYKDSDVDYLVENSSAFNKTHSWSFKALNEFIPWLLEENLNQMQLAHNKGIKVNRELDFSKSKYITKDWIQNLVITPTAKRSLIQTINVINAILKQYVYKKSHQYEIDNIVIEMARELNNTQAKEKIQAIQAFGTERNKKLEAKIKFVEDALGSRKIAKSWLKKLYLLEQQNGLDAYDGKPLDWKDVVFEKVKTDIDHIIPYSVCFDDSNANKVLTKANNNSLKGNKTPYQFLSKEEFAKMTKLWEVWYKSIKGEDNFFKSNKKLDFLTTTLDYSLPENSFGFIGRNLVDTRYVTKEIYAVLSKFFKAKDFNTKVKTINGRMTSFIRSYMRSLDIPEIPTELKAYVDEEVFNKKEQMKIRTWHGHHAQDAVIIASSVLANQKILKESEKLLSDPNYSPKQKEKYVTAKINTFNPKDSLIFDEIKKTLNKNVNKVKFSYMLNRQKTIELFNETFYGGIRIKDEKKDKEYITKVSKTDYLINLTKADCAKLFDNTKTKLACFKFDKPLYDELKTIYLANEDGAYPFKNAIGDQKVDFITLKNNRRIKKLKKLEENKELLEIIVPSKNKNKNSFYDTMNWISIRLFKNSKGKNKIIPINATNYDFHKNKIKNDVYNQQLKNYNIVNDKYIEIYRGTILVNKKTKVQYRVSGHLAKADKLELKPLSFKNKGQMHKTLNTFLKNFNIININPIGKISENLDLWKF